VLQGIEVFKDGEPTAFDRAAASKAMATEDVKLELKLKDGPGRALVMTSDLGYRYVQVNAEYTT
jgi:N-acetylglutamate synthase/N-acetylornithine aminotransferase